MAEWSAADVNNLPDSAFLYVSPGGSIDSDGRTTPRSLRHFPYRGKDGAIDLPHLRNAIGRIPQASIPAAKKSELQAHAQKLLEGTKDARDLERVYRLDLSSGSIGQKRRTPQGGLIADANLTRTGVFEYRDSNGGTRRELRHPDEVFHPDSMATYPLAPVTVDHPGRVGPHNWKEHAVGTVGPDVRQNGHFVTGEIHIQHQNAMDRALDGDLKEISCGYHCDVDPTPGVYQGKPYDVAQKNMRINHVAIGPEGWGRMGPETRMHLDAGAAVSDSFVEDAPENKSAMAFAASAKASAARKPLDTGGAHSDPTVAPTLTPQGTYGHSQPTEKTAGEAHLAAARAHKRAAWKATKDGMASLASHHEQHEAAHMNAAADHAKAAGSDWDSEKHPLNAAGKFDASDRTDGAIPYVHRDHPNEASTMTPEEKAAFDKAQQEAASAKADLEKVRQDAVAAKAEQDKALTKVKEQEGALASLQGQVAVLSRQVEQRGDSLTAEQRRHAEAKQQLDVEELIGLRADARMVFATVDDPEGKNWKPDGKNSEAIRREVITLLEPSVKLDSVTGDNLKPLYDIAIAGKRRADKERAKLDEVINGPRVDGTNKPADDDEEEEMDAAKAYKDMAKRKRDAWKMPKKDRGRGRKAAAA